MLRMLLISSLLLSLAASARGEVAILEPERDATLIESATGERANGSGPALFAGRNAAAVGSLRRALLAFDVAGALPAGAWVHRAELELVVLPSNPVPIELGLHRVQTPWTEGPSSASGGGGAPAEPGDATWLHASYDDDFWSTPGGDHDPGASAVQLVAGDGLYLWSSTPELARDVEQWLDDPASNHGWLLRGGADERQSAKRIGSREGPAELRPRLVIEFAPGCGDAGLGPGAVGLCRAYCEALTCADAPRASPRACERLARGFARRTGGRPLPCEAAAGPR